MESAEDYQTYKALLDWQIELGATEAIGDVPVNRFEAPKKLAEPARPAAAPATPVAEPRADPVGEARAAASAAGTLDDLKPALAAYDHCPLKRGARNLVFADGRPGARVMIIGEAPGREEDLQAKPFVGPAGQLLDRMLAAIGLNRAAEEIAQAVYITNVVPWRPPQNRNPNAQEIAMMRPFVQRHVDLAEPEIVVLMGNISCDAGLGKQGITRLRGQWTEAYGKPCLPMLHPAHLLRTPAAKRETWADLLELQARLEGTA
ncbi:uracil-DNA glycosylase [Roseovarius aestuariivivens]|uniref:uracil-DNA glycosylase n=1 Tax=Roseovarius aestuariivivens TaxID=1888910 RepID=UPI0010808867|nr:uracil-DNA glycosylase [Roseovarius aestuariivivens]